MIRAGRFQKKAVVIEAERWDGTVTNAADIVDWILALGGTARYHPDSEDQAAHIAIDSYDDGDETVMEVVTGYWVVRGVRGDFYSMGPNAFIATYEPVGWEWAR